MHRSRDFRGGVSRPVARWRRKRKTKRKTPRRARPQPLARCSTLRKVPCVEMERERERERKMHRERAREIYRRGRGEGGREKEREAVRRRGKRFTPRDGIGTRELPARRDNSRGRGYFSAGHVHSERHFCRAEACQPSIAAAAVHQWIPTSLGMAERRKESLRVTHGCRGRRADASAGATGCGSVRESRHLGAWGRGARKTTRKTTDSLSLPGLVRSKRSSVT